MLSINNLSLLPFYEFIVITFDQLFIQEENKAAATDIAIETKDWGQLVDIVLRGEADLLVGKTSEDNEVQEFIKNAQTFKTKVNKIHEGKNNVTI